MTQLSPKTQLLRRFSLGLIAGSVLLAAGTASAQFSVSPSQTSLFYNDLRQRAQQQNGTSVDESASRSSGNYDFDPTAGYTGDSSGRPMGEREAFDYEGARGMGQQNTRSGSVGYSRRAAGDYTSSGSPYPSTGTFFAPTYITDPFLAGKRNIKLGGMNIGLGLSANAEYNDNINRGNGSNRLDEYIAGAYVNLDARYPITRNNSLNLTGLIGVDHYFNHPELSGNGKDFVTNVAPGSSISFDVRVGDVLFVIYDRISVRPASQDSFSLDNKDIFSVFNNDAGLAMNWDINSRLNLSLNFNRADSQALSDVYKIYDRSINSYSGSLAWRPTGTYTVGLEGSYSTVNYDQNYNTDGTTLSLGVFFILPISHSTVLKASGGYQHFTFDAPPSFTRTVTDASVATLQNTLTALDNQIANVNKTSPDAATAQANLAALQAQRNQVSNQLSTAQVTKQREDATYNAHTFDNSTKNDGYYYNVTFVNQLNARMNQFLNVGHESTLNTNSNFITSDYVTYGIGAIAWRGSRLTVSGYYEHSDESGGRLAENIDQYGIDVSLIHRLSDHLSVALGYHYGNTDSNQLLRDYSQNSYSIDFSYALSRRMSLGFGYRYWTTSAEDPTQDFDQNRFIMTMNYNF